MPQHLADTMHDAWSAFIKTGTVYWPGYTLTHRTTMVFNDTSATVDDPMSEERAIWQGVR